ncbi:MAG: hypothetical protein CMJ18_11140 [Phycisphaeraceae bacterium]|nr:hypothetical protein [Phycisphaeraceae bacterium]
MISRQCAQCSYDLSGLVEVGECPECGSSYNGRTGKGLVDVENVEQRFTERLRRVRTIALVIFAFIAMGCAGLGTVIAQNTGRMLMFGALVSVVILMAAFTSYLYEKDDT